MISEHNISPVVTSVNHIEFCQTLSVFVMHISYHVVIESLAEIFEIHPQIRNHLVEQETLYSNPAMRTVLWQLLSVCFKASIGH